MQAGGCPGKSPGGAGAEEYWIQGGMGPEPIPLYINVKALFFQGKCTNLCKQNQQISALNNWILRRLSGIIFSHAVRYAKNERWLYRRAAKRPAPIKTGGK
jgi:hypothetical protein